MELNFQSWIWFWEVQIWKNLFHRKHLDLNLRALMTAWEAPWAYLNCSICLFKILVLNSWTLLKLEYSTLCQTVISNLCAALNLFFQASDIPLVPINQTHVIYTKKNPSWSPGYCDKLLVNMQVILDRSEASRKTIFVQCNVGTLITNHLFELVSITSPPNIFVILVWKLGWGKKELTSLLTNDMCSSLEFSWQLWLWSLRQNNNSSCAVLLVQHYQQKLLGFDINWEGTKLPGRWRRAILGQYSSCGLTKTAHEEC